MNAKLWFRVILMGLMLSALVLAGCDDGDDGDNGAPGASAYEIAVENGFDGTEQEWLDSLTAAGEVSPVEACATCHGSDKAYAVEDAHTEGATDISVSIDSVTEVGADLVATFTVLLDGEAAEDFDTGPTRDYRLADVAGTMTRLDLSTDDGITAVLAGGTDGEYTITIPGAVVVGGIATENSRYMFRIENSGSDVDGYRALIVFDYPLSPIADVLTAAENTCANCHGSFGDGFHYGYPANNGKTCQVCHDADDNTFPYIGEMLHGLHSSASMPSGEFQPVRKDGTLLVDRSGNDVIYEIAFPSYMNNCSNCHEIGASLTAAIAEPVTYDFCMTCHEDWTGFDFVDAEGVTILNHSGFTSATNCAVCHEDTIAPATVGGMHNNSQLGGMTSGRGGLIHDGYDAAVEEGARVDVQIAEVTRTGDVVAIDWTVTVDDAQTDPCAIDPEAGPVFTSGYSVLKAFFQGGDLVNADNGASSPGQPNNTAIDFDATDGNTVCAANVATTTITLTAEEAALTGNARFGLQGRPLFNFAPASLPAGTDILVRAKSPIYDFALADGAAVAARRGITDSAKCLGCHKGSLYQHGGNRIDNVELCVMCHNEASSEQNVREGYGVDASEAYDGKSGQTYGFKSMLHAVHASGHAEKPLVIYRGRGIYAFAPSRDMLPNWPGEGRQTIYGAAIDPETGVAFTQTHNFVTAHYPQDLNECAACHVDGFAMVPDQTVSVATTVNAGAPPYDNQLDDTLQGTVAATCLGCHQSAPTMSHAYKEGFFPTTFENGRQDVIDAAK